MSYQYPDYLSPTDISALKIATDLVDCSEETWMKALQYVIDFDLQECGYESVNDFTERLISDGTLQTKQNHSDDYKDKVYFSIQ